MEFVKRIESVRKILKKQKLDAVLISSVPNIIYLTGYSGFSKDEREAFLIITKNEEFLLTDGRYKEAVKYYIPHFSLFEINPTTTLTKILKEIRDAEQINRLGFEASNISYLEYERLKKFFKRLVKIDLSSLRLIKDKDEIDFIRESCKIADRVFPYLLSKIKTGITEKELAFILESFIRKSGADISFPTIVAFGKNSSIPHHQTSNERLMKNNIILLDFGVKINNYCSDMTRTIYFGKADDKFKNIYNTVLESQKKAIDFIFSKKNIAKASEVDKIARQIIEKAGFPTIPHSLGHGVGVEVHEAPRLSIRSKEKLEEGMVFSIEPGIYLPGWGGVRIEDLVVVINGRLEILTKSSKNLIEL